MPKAKKPFIHHPLHRSTILLSFILLFLSFILWLVFAKRLDDSVSVKYTCPATSWIDCMPGPGQPLSYQCTTEYFNWAKVNCPGFEGIAR